MTARLLVIGSANVDLFAHVARHPTPGETILGQGGERAGGGKGANQALAAALQGAPVTFVGAVGQDGDADVALGALRTAGVDLSRVAAVADAPTGLAIITVSADGENTIVVISGANATVTPEQAEAAVAASGPDDVVLLQGELPRTTTEAAVRAAVAAGRRVVLNVAPWNALDRDVLTSADPLVLNEHEAAQAVEELGLEASGDGGTALAEALVTAGTPSVVVTLGAEGAAVVDASGTDTVPSRRVTAVDTTGAGDAFTGALAARLIAGDPLRAAVEHAVRVGAYAVQHHGAQPSYPGLEQELP
ncbi:ribokinase [Ornithinimicrobium tianjinense]|uniref:Ribokinase n=1 Tax=Ornithinimicrobium tianjinense TaxID=1195761 RepID=A0A917BGV0_9MICO|nr:ribokinase [Ornithinimicrobium tianjinense]GGF40570.1 ribokinase [Ornithinimicrobium tianjinense]